MVQLSSDIRQILNQIRAKVGVVGRHVNFTVVVLRSNRDDVTRFQDENTACVCGTVVAFSRPRGSKQGHGFAVDINIDPSSAVIVGLQVDIVPSGGRHSQFSIMILHAACKMAIRGTDRPVFNHYGVENE